MDPLIITVAPVGAEVMPDQTPYLPDTPVQLGETAAAIREAGASIIHVHCRNDDGTNTHDVERFRAGLRGDPRRERSDRAVLDRRGDRDDARGAGRRRWSCGPRWRR